MAFLRNTSRHAALEIRFPHHQMIAEANQASWEGHARPPCGSGQRKATCGPTTGIRRRSRSSAHGVFKRGRAEVARQPHKLEVVGSNPTPAPKSSRRELGSLAEYGVVATPRELSRSERSLICRHTNQGTPAGSIKRDLVGQPHGGVRALWRLRISRSANVSAGVTAGETAHNSRRSHE